MGWKMEVEELEIGERTENVQHYLDASNYRGESRKLMKTCFYLNSSETQSANDGGKTLKELL